MGNIEMPLPQTDMEICLMLSRLFGNGVQEDETVAQNLYRIARTRRGSSRTFAREHNEGRSQHERRRARGRTRQKA